MRAPIARIFSVLATIACAVAAPVTSESVAHADATRTPTLSSYGRRVEATEELRALVAALPVDARAHLPGVYVAFAETATDVSALAACDDDGDYVVVLSDALLVLVEHATHAAVLDEAGADQKLFELADHYAWEQKKQTRLLPPPPGAFDLADTRAIEIAHTQRFRQAISGILARELAVMKSGDLVCAHPTATRERGDDVWTAEEDEAAHRNAEVLYASATNRDARDLEALDLEASAGHDPLGYLAWLSFLARMEEAHPRAGWSYPRTHEGARSRHTHAVLHVKERK